ncbi:MAG: SH3 domain-containing protein, partial [Woeseiaceae bacterium]
MRIPASAFLVLLCGAAFGPQSHADVVVPIDTVEQHVNIRFAPDAGSEIVGRLMQGTGLPHVRSVEGWHEVELDGGGTGYVSADWAVIVAAVANEPAADDAPAAGPEGEADAVRDAAPGEAATLPHGDPVVAAAPQAEPGEPAGPGGDATASPEAELPASAVATGIEGSVDYLVKFVAPGEGGSSQIFDDGRNIGIGTDEPKQRLEVNGNIQ